MFALHWAFEPSVLTGLALLTAGYSAAVGPLRRRLSSEAAPPAWRQAVFHLGTLSVFLALVSPLDDLADHYLFSAHMVQHLLLILVAAPLWLLGTPGWLAKRLVPRGWPSAALHWLTQPLQAFLIFNVVLWAWHLPRAYDAALADEGLHVFEHVTFLLAALIGWWPLLGPHPDAPPVSQPLQVLYLFLQSLPATALAALITLAPTPLYRFYVLARFYVPAPAIAGISPLLDQQLSGLIMWIPGTMIFFLALSLVFFRWFGSPPADAEVLVERSQQEAMHG
jgi:putative membrane protein